jgi:hypothetical protein
MSWRPSTAARARTRGDEFIPLVNADGERRFNRQRLHSDNEIKRIGVVRRREQLQPQLLRRHDGCFGAAVGQDMRVIAHGVGDIERHGNGARRHDRKIGDEPFRSTFTDDRNPIAGFDAETAQGFREFCHLIDKLAPARRQIGAFAVALRPHDGPVALSRGLVDDHLHQILGGFCAHRLVV